MSNKFVLVLGWFSLFCLPLHVGTFHVSVETGDDSNPGSPGRWTKEEKQPICGVGGSPIGRGKQLIGCTIFGYTDGILVGSSEDLLIQGHLDQGTDHVIEDVRQRLPGKEIWVTEWNTRGADYQIKDEPTPAMHIQLVSRMTLALLRHREVTMSLFFTLNFLRHGPAGGAFQGDGKDGYQPMPHVLALRWFHEAANGGAKYQQFPDAGAQRKPGGGALDESYFAVEAGLFRKPKVVTLIIQNCSAESRLFRLPKAVSEKAPARVETLATPDLTTTSANITPTGQSVEAGGDVRIPAYSITRLIWR